MRHISTMFSSYDDYGRVKKKYRSVEDRAARETAALARLRGDYDPSPSGQVNDSTWILAMHSAFEKCECRNAV